MSRQRVFGIVLLVVAQCVFGNVSSGGDMPKPKHITKVNP
jgi:hypothetical protein